MKVLHILKEGPTELSQRIINIQSADQNNEIEIIDLSKKNATYEETIDKIFSCDKVISW